MTRSEFYADFVRRANAELIPGWTEMASRAQRVKRPKGSKPRVPKY